MDLESGTLINHYEILSTISKGGMGEVFLARDTKLDRKVAIKFLASEFSNDFDKLHRFSREAKAASALNHPNILTVHEVGDFEGTNYIVTEFIEGKTLGDLLSHNEPLQLDLSLKISVQMADAIAAAHEAGIIHRDIKPDNVMIRPDGLVKVLDFGIAKTSERIVGTDSDDAGAKHQVQRSEEEIILGTANYMSPEQVEGNVVDGRSDIFSFGSVLYEMLSGRQAFIGENASDVIGAILSKKPIPLGQIRPELPGELQRIVRKTLRKDRQHRYQTAQRLLGDLKDIRSDLDFRSNMERSTDPNREYTKTQIIGPSTSAYGHIWSRAGAGITTLSRTKALILIAALIAVASAFFFSFEPGRAGIPSEDTILLTDFANNTGDPLFDGTLKQALSVQLGQSPFLNIFSEVRVRETLKFMERSPDDPVTRDVGREICQRQGLKAMLAGSIASVGNHYVITLEAINAQTGDAIAAEQAEAENKEQVLYALDQAVMKLREKLGESLQSIQQFDARIEQATTPSLEAFKAFSLGVEQQLNGKYLEAIPFFKRATEIDADFALAHARMASIYYNSRQYDLAAEASQKAYDLRDRVSERERLYISAGYHDNVTGELDKYLETLDVWKHTFPREAPPHNSLALKYNELGQFDEALEAARESIRLNPNSASGYSLLASSLVGLNRFDDAKEIIGQALAQELESSAMRRTLYRIAFIQGDATTMRQQIEWTKGRPDEYVAQNWQAETAAFSGQLRKAREFSNRAFDLASARDLKDVAAQILVAAATRDALLGDCRLVRPQTAKALGLSRRHMTVVYAGNALAACGELSQAQRLIDELVKTFPKDTILNNVLLPLVQARIELHKGNPTRAIQVLETTKPYEGYALSQIAYLRGQAYLKQQRGADAAAEFGKIVNEANRGSLPFYPLAKLGLARAAALNGDTTYTRQAYREFFTLWKDAELDMPALVQATREFERL